MTHFDVPLKPCGCVLGDACDHLTARASAAEMARLLRERPRIVMPTGPAADAERARNDATNPLLVAMRAAATTRFDAKGQPR